MCNIIPCTEQSNSVTASCDSRIMDQMCVECMFSRGITHGLTPREDRWMRKHLLPSSLGVSAILWKILCVTYRKIQSVMEMNRTQTLHIAWKQNCFLYSTQTKLFQAATPQCSLMTQAALHIDFIIPCDQEVEVVKLSKSLLTWRRLWNDQCECRKINNLQSNTDMSGTRGC